MAEKLDPQQVVPFEELLWSMMYERKTTSCILVRKGLVFSEEVLREINGVRQEEMTYSPKPPRRPGHRGVS